MNKTHAVLSVAAIAVSGLALTGCSPHHESPTPRQTVVSHPSYAESFADLNEMSIGADVVVHGTVTSAAPGEPIRDIVTSTYAFKVDNWIKGTPTNDGQITLFQTGGVQDGVAYLTEDDPLMTVGEEAVLYLEEGDPGIFHTVAGPTGRLDVTAGQVRKLAGSSITTPVPSTIRAVEAATQAALR